MFMDYKTEQEDFLKLEQLVKNMCGNAKGQEQPRQLRENKIAGLLYLVKLNFKAIVIKTICFWCRNSSEGDTQTCIKTFAL